MRLRNSQVITGAAVAFSCATTSALAQVGEIPDRNGFYYHDHDMMWGGSQWGGFGMVLGPIFPSNPNSWRKD